MKQIAVIGAGVSGLTCAVLLAERGERVTLLAAETGRRTTSAAAGAIWFPYDVEPLDKVTAWSLRTFDRFATLAKDPASGVLMIELRCFARFGEIEVPYWAPQLGARRLQTVPRHFTSGFTVNVPLIDTSIYLQILMDRFQRASGEVRGVVEFSRLEDVPREFETIVNCAGVGARELAADLEVEPHRGQVVLVERNELDHAIVCDDPPLMYIFPRRNDCVFGGTNTISANREPSTADRASIIEECSRVLDAPPPAIREDRVGLRPYRRSGVRLEGELLGDGRTVLHNYGHGGAGFTLSWGCAEDVAQLAQS